MGSLMESKLTPEQHALIKKVLVAQTEALGEVEAPIVEDLLRKHKCRRVLDIGCGEGSFLLRLAQRMKGARFLGIDHSELAIGDAARQARRRSLRHVKLKQAFFDAGFERARYDAILTRYTLQHASDPRAFVGAVRNRLWKEGLFVSVESLDACSGCHQADPVWERFLGSLAAIHRRGGSDENVGKRLGRLLAEAGFREIQVRAVLCSPSTVGWKRFQAVVRASAETAASLCPDLFDLGLLEQVKTWLDDRAGLERKDPYLCTAVANATRP